MITQSLKSLLGRLRLPQEPGVTNGDLRFEHLDWLQRRHAFIDVRAARIDQQFQSLLLQIDSVLGELIFDDFYPVEGSEQLRNGDLLEVTSRNGDRPLHFVSRLLGRELRGDGPVYRLELPASISTTGTRQAYRVYVDGEPGLSMEINLESGQPLACRPVNLSVEGVKLDIDGDVTRLLEQHSHYGDCTIQLPDGTLIECQLDLRNFRLMHAPVPHTLAGGTLQIAHAPHRVKLGQYLAAVQRRQRRRELRLGS